jgi:hypothetical protein
VLEGERDICRSSRIGFTGTRIVFFCWILWIDRNDDLRRRSDTVPWSCPGHLFLTCHDYCFISTIRSPTPLWHMMIAVSVIMYSTSYYARDYKLIQARHALEKDAVKEYYEKHGGAPGHH